MEDTPDIKTYLSEQKKEIDTFLEVCVRDADCLHGAIYEAVSYSLFAGGKRVRPILSLAASEFIHGSRQAALAGGCAVEMVHTYSLVHDDLPCMDDDDMRRGKPSSHKKFGEATAVLAGDALQAMAFQLIPEHVTSPQMAADMVRELAAAAGPEGMVGGQVLDVVFEKEPCTLEDLHTLHAMKTGALITASVRIGILSGSCSEEEEEKITAFSRTLGLLFQVVDDILDRTGDADKLGKAAGRDSALNKTTFPSLMGLNEACTYRDSLMNKALGFLEPFDAEADLLRTLCTFIATRDY